jgi:hypothetical protein
MMPSLGTCVNGINCYRTRSIPDDWTPSDGRPLPTVFLSISAPLWPGVSDEVFPEPSASPPTSAGPGGC